MFLGVACDSEQEKVSRSGGESGNHCPSVGEERYFSSNARESHEHVGCLPSRGFIHASDVSASFQKTGGRNRNPDIVATENTGLFLEVLKWFEVREHIYRASWYKAVHKHQALQGHRILLQGVSALL